VHPSLKTSPPEAFRPEVVDQAVEELLVGSRAEVARRLGVPEEQVTNDDPKFQRVADELLQFIAGLVAVIVLHGGWEAAAALAIVVGLAFGDSIVVLLAIGERPRSRGPRSLLA